VPSSSNLARNLAVALDSAALFETVVGGPPDPWQLGVLESPARAHLLLCSRQSGKTTCGAVLALRELAFAPRSLSVLVSPSLRQSTEILRRVLEYYRALPGAPDLKLESATRLETGIGSRCISLPASEGTVRGLSAVGLLVLDEAAQLSTSLIASVRPMQATVRGARVIAMSTPNGSHPDNWFFGQWTRGVGWQRETITADQCRRISPEFLKQELALLGPSLYRQEYCCEFAATAGSMFPPELIEAALDPSVVPLWPIGEAYVS
jgi:hypothetical protein